MIAWEYHGNRGFCVASQADFLKVLYDKMMELHVKHVDGPEEWRYPLPSFKVYSICYLPCIMSNAFPSLQALLCVHMSCLSVMPEKKFGWTIYQWDGMQSWSSFACRETVYLAGVTLSMISCKENTCTRAFSKQDADVGGCALAGGGAVCGAGGECAAAAQPRQAGRKTQHPRPGKHLF